MKFLRITLTLGLLRVLSPMIEANGQSFTDKQFESRSSEEIVGTISSVQINYSDQYGEQGTVVVKIDQAIAGSITAPTISLQYAREFAPISQPTSWDLIFPDLRSLKGAVGAKVLAFVVNTDGNYSLYPASNSMQSVSSGTILGTLRISRNHIGIPLIYDWHAGLTIAISEVVFGWTKDNSITLPVNIQSLGDLIDDEWCARHDGGLVLVNFKDSTITSIQVADSTVLEQLKITDSQ